MKLVKYDAACRAVAEARSIDEVKDIRNKAVAIEAYARQAKNKDLEADAYEIRKRAEEKLGALMAAQPKAAGARGSGSNQHRKKVRVAEKPAPTLAEAGIDKNLADRARKAHKLKTENPEEWERVIAEGREDVRRRAERAAEAKINRQEKHRNIAAKAKASAETSDARFIPGTAHVDLRLLQPMKSFPNPNRSVCPQGVAASTWDAFV